MLCCFVTQLHDPASWSGFVAQFFVARLHVPALWPSFVWPSFVWPSFGWPSFGWPSFVWPSFGWPSFGWPSFVWPSFVWPSFVWPSFGWPSFGWPSFVWPSFGWPSFGWPSFVWPSFGWPSFGWPSFEWPSFVWPSCEAAGGECCDWDVSSDSSAPTSHTDESIFHDRHLGSKPPPPQPLQYVASSASLVDTLRSPLTSSLCAKTQTVVMRSVHHNYHFTETISIISITCRCLSVFLWFLLIFMDIPVNVGRRTFESIGIVSLVNMHDYDW